MDNKLQLFDFEGQNLAIKEINGEVYFNAEQAAIGLGISQIARSGNAIARWDRVNKYLLAPTSGCKIRRGDYITEPQFYKLAIKANNPVAERFQDWVTSEVLPAIRKHGAYMTDRKAYDITHDKSGTALADLLQQAADQLKQKDIQIEEMKPKAKYCDIVLQNKKLVTITQIAKDYGMSGQEMNRKLHDLKVIFKQGGTWFLYSKYQNTGWTQSETFMTHKQGGTHQKVVLHTKWTQKGRLGLYELLKKHGILPLIEREENN
mgnify:CR=1 FL=1